MFETNCLSVEQLVYFLDRHRKNDAEIQDFNFQAALLKVMEELREFVPSEGIYILLDVPTQFVDEGAPKNLAYVAGYGEKSSQIVGLKTVSTQGLISQAYRTGMIQTVKATSNIPVVIDRIHLPKEMKDAVCVPLKIASATIGVLVLYNKQDTQGYTMKDVRLITILAGYLSVSIQVAVDTKKNKELTKRDNLTGLYNDRYFHSQLEKEIFSAERNKTDLILMFFDLDNFKSVNDRYGHLVGSQTLKEVAFVFREIISVPNATLARYGGDEYVCIIPGINLVEGERLANALREKISEKMYIIDSGHEDGSFISFKGVISASIGISSLHEHTLPSTDTRQRKNTFVRIVDQAMYEAKDKGKNCVSVSRPAT